MRRPILKGILHTHTNPLVPNRRLPNLLQAREPILFIALTRTVPIFYFARNQRIVNGTCGSEALRASLVVVVCFEKAWIGFSYPCGFTDGEGSGA